MKKSEWCYYLFSTPCSLDNMTTRTGEHIWTLNIRTDITLKLKLNCCNNLDLCTLWYWIFNTIWIFVCMQLLSCVIFSIWLLSHFHFPTGNNRVNTNSVYLSVPTWWRLVFHLWDSIVFYPVSTLIILRRGKRTINLQHYKLCILKWTWIQLCSPIFYHNRKRNMSFYSQLTSQRTLPGIWDDRQLWNTAMSSYAHFIKIQTIQKSERVWLWTLFCMSIHDEYTT